MPLQDENIQKLIIENITASAKLDARLSSVEQAISNLRIDNEKSLNKISDSLEKLAAIQTHLLSNTEQHKAMHERIDGVKEEVEALESLVLGMQKSCQGANHADISKRIVALETKMTSVTTTVKLLDYKLFGVPLWVGAIGLILFSAICDFANHQEWIQKWIR